MLHACFHLERSCVNCSDFLLGHLISWFLCCMLVSIMYICSWHFGKGLRMATRMSRAYVHDSEKDSSGLDFYEVASHNVACCFFIFCFLILNCAQHSPVYCANGKEIWYNTQVQKPSRLLVKVIAVSAKFLNIIPFCCFSWIQLAKKILVKSKLIHILRRLCN